MNFLSHKLRESKLNYLFIPIPQDLIGQWQEENRSASEIEQFYWMLGKLKIPGFKVTERYASAQLNITRHQARSLKKQCLTLLDMKSTKLQPKTCKTQPSTETQTQSCDTVILDFPEKSTKTQPKTCKSQPHNKEKRKEKELINYYKTKLGKNFSDTLKLKSIADVWNHWFDLYPSARTVNQGDARVIKAALKGYSVGELILIVDWAHLSEDYAWQRENGYTKPKNFLNRERLDDNYSKALDWKQNKSRPSMPQKLSALPKMRNHSTVNQFGPNGHLLPEYGGKVRPGGKY